MKNSTLLRVCALALIMSTAGCGIKPGTVEPPEGVDNHFPRTYPDVTTDPPPYVRPGS